MIKNEFVILDLTNDSTITNKDFKSDLTFLKKDASQFLEEGHADCFLEFFLQIHGIQPESNESTSLLLSYKGNSVFSHELISKIIKKTPGDRVPVVHLLSCYSGGAHFDLKEVSNDIILCTYSESDSITIERFSNYFIKKRTEADSLSKYILDNLESCAAVGFCISVKIAGKVHVYKLNSEIFTSDKDSQQIISFLEEEKKNFQSFIDKIPILKNNNARISTSISNLLINEEKYSGIDVALTIASANHKLDKIKNLLNKVEAIHPMAIQASIKENTDKLETLEFLLESKKFKKDQITKEVITIAIDRNYLALALLLIHNNEVIEDVHLFGAIEKSEIRFLQLLLSYDNGNNSKISASVISWAVHKNFEALNILLSKNSNAVTILRL